MERKKLKKKFELKSIIIWKLVYLIVIFCLIQNNSFAYLDPGTGTLIMQFLVAAFAACSLFIKQIIAKVKTFLKKIFGSEKDQENK